MNAISKEILDLAEGNAQEAAQLQSAQNALAPHLSPVSPAFNDSLRAQLTAPAAGHKTRAAIARILAIAAILLLGIFLGAALFTTHASPLGESVAWSDVVQAVNTIDHFHISVFAQEPRNINEPPMYRLDLYYQHPGQWRGQGLDYVQFTTPAASKLFSIKDKTWLPADQSKIRLVPTDIVEGMPQKPLLQILLEKIFDGKPPAGEPVKNDALATAGIEVFDYAYNPSQMWARIWVLKDSRIPIRMKLYHPGSNDFMLIEFDYSEPQPPSFFDPASFEKSLADLHTDNPDSIYSIGSQPILGTKPQNASQINAASGGYHAPTLYRALANDAGDIALITSIPVNRTPQGNSPFEEHYESISDSWGNNYLQIGFSEGISPTGDRRWYLSPIPPLKTATIPHTLTFTYNLRTAENGRVTFIDHPLSTQTIPFPDASTPAQPNDWDNSYLQSAKLHALRTYFQSTATLADQLTLVNAALAKNPTSIDDLLWMQSLLRQHNRETQAWKFFEQNLLTPLTENQNISDPTVLGQYLIYLQSQNRTADLTTLITHLEKIHTAALASKDRNTRDQATQNFDSKWSLLAGAMHLPEWLHQLDTQKPTLLHAITSKDGYLLVQLQVPTQPKQWQSNGASSGPHFSIDHGWFWDALPQSPEFANFLPAAQLTDNTTGDLWLAFRLPANNTADHLTLGSTVEILRDNYNYGHAQNPILHPWSLNIPIPAPTLDSLPTWWQQNTDNRNAFEWFAQIAQTPATPYVAPPLTETQQLAQTLETQSTEARTLITAGNLKEAQQKIQTMLATLPAMPDITNDADTLTRRTIRSTQLAYITALTNQKEFTQAKTLLDQIAATRPNLADIHDKVITIDLGHGAQTTHNLRQFQRDAWQEYDTVWWNLHDAQTPPQPH